MKREPDVPSSKTCPATDFITSPEKKEETRAITGKRAIGIKNFDFGICIMPLERVEAKNMAINNTMTVTKKANFEEYKETMALGKNIIGVRNIRAKRQYSKTLLKLNPEPVCVCCSIIVVSYELIIN
jgi:hypothetical protein